MHPLPPGDSAKWCDIGAWRAEGLRWSNLAEGVGKCFCIDKTLGPAFVGAPGFLSGGGQGTF